MLKTSSDSSQPRPDSKAGPGPPPAISRRQFSRKVALAAAASISAPALLAASSAPSAVEQDQKNEPLKGLTPQQIAEVDAKLANILRKYGDRFSDDQKKRLRRILAQHQRLMAPVREFAVQNGDPPASVLRVSFDRLSEHKEGSGD
ncbi:MAG TPA: hypothetical protein VJW93_06945 [Candidatus Acidoferrales bacterium]|nr:hypothetical protein [Candidatus Acidoferrales bacterium]